MNDEEVLSSAHEESAQNLSTSLSKNEQTCSLVWIIVSANKMNGRSRQGRIRGMSLFNKKETIVFKSEQQKDAYIERLEKAHAEYDVFEDRDTIYSKDVSYIIRVKVSDLKKVS